MKIEPIGELHPDTRFPESLKSKETRIPFLSNQKLTITFDDIVNDPMPEEFAEAIRNFMQLSEQDRAKTDKYVFADYEDFVECVGEYEFDFEIESAHSVWEFIRPTDIYVIRRRADKAVYVQIAAHCDWEEEHGLQVVFRDGKTLKRVSSQDGHLTNSDAYARPELEDVIFDKRWD